MSAPIPGTVISNLQTEFALTSTRTALSHIRLARQLIKEGLIDDPPMFQICLGVPWGADQTVDNMKAMKDQLPANASWASFGISRIQMPIAAAAVAMGGNVRVGLEDSLWLGRGQLAKSNAEQVTKVRRILEELGLVVATADGARQMLKLKGRGAVGF